jgi:signal transduction histidine kinase
MIVPLVLGEQRLGVFELHFRTTMRFARDDLELAQALVHHATLALQVNRLARRAEQTAVTEERNRLAREIHDTLAQAFAGVVLHAEALEVALGVNKQRSKRALSHIKKLARSGLDEARRSVRALRPKALERNTLPNALEEAAQHFSADGKHSCKFKQQGKPASLSAETQNELFRIAQEAMTNVRKHAQAKSVWIGLAFKTRQVTLTVRDDGVGLPTINSTVCRGRYGLATMQERAKRIGGRMKIEGRKNRGTSVRVLVPLTK